MKLIHSIILFAFAACCLSVVAVGMQDPAEYRLDMSSIDLPVVFQDQSLSEAEKNTILQDYRQILAGLKPQSMRRSKVQTFRQGDSTIRATKELQYSAGYLKRPDGFEDQFGVVGTSTNGQEQIIIPNKLSDGYKTAIQLKRTHQRACDALLGFIQLMNQLDAEKLPPVRDLLYLHGEAQRFADEIDNKSPQEFVDDYDDHRYASGSLLELTEKDGKLMTSMHVIDKGSGKRVGEMPILYDGGHWKIYITLAGQ